MATWTLRPTKTPRASMGALKPIPKARRSIVAVAEKRARNSPCRSRGEIVELERERHLSAHAAHRQLAVNQQAWLARRMPVER
jgi:hypothetical protein